MSKDNQRAPAGTCDWIPPAGREEKTGAGCAPAAAPAAADNRSAFYAFRPDFTWAGVTTERYKAEEGNWAAIARNVLVGARGESALFELRYFEIAPGGHSSLEEHRHEHVVVCVRGQGRVLVTGGVREMNFLDTVYIAPDDPHQLLNPYDDTFGFFCIVNRDRDRPRALNGEKLARLLAGEAAGKICP